MTNFEKNANKLKDILCYGDGGFAVRKDTEEIVKCDDGSISCDDCVFESYKGVCEDASRKWLDEEYEEPKAPEIDWSKVPVDTPILVYNGDGYYKTKRHFAKFENDMIYAWADGITSYTKNEDDEPVPWSHAKIAPGIDCSGWYKQGGH